MGQNEIHKCEKEEQDRRKSMCFKRFDLFVLHLSGDFQRQQGGKITLYHEGIEQLVSSS